MSRPVCHLLAVSLGITAVGAVAWGCGKKGTPTGGPSGAVVPPEKSAAPTRKADKAAGVHERVKIKSGALTAGSTPGDEGRDPLLEPVLLPVELGPFEIDRLPFPNDPGKPARTGVTREEARALCREQGARLCSELEWERACKGDDGDLYAAGNAWDPQCAKDPNTCASSLGVLAMGGALREWTDSELVAPGDDKRRADVRGAAASADGVDHRCAHRGAVDGTTKGNDLGFRCCKGPPNAAAIPAPRSAEVSFSKESLDIKKVQRALQAIPELSAYAKDVSYFPEDDAVKAVLSRGDAGLKPGPVVTTSPVAWNPLPTEDVVVLALRAKASSLILAFYKLPDDKLRLASSLVLKDENGPVVLSFTSFNKKRVAWSTCWECPGEYGAVELRDNRRIVISHY